MILNSKMNQRKELFQQEKYTVIMKENWLEKNNIKTNNWI